MIKALQISGLSFSYDKDGSKLLNDIDLTIYQGEILAILGLSGSGKSTLCNIISGVIPRTIKGCLEGEIKVFGKDLKDMSISELTQKIGIVFQDPDTQLFSPTVIDEIAFGMENHCFDVIKMEEKIKIVSEQTGIDKHLYSNPNNLSGGEKQLVVLSSILCIEPQIILLDEAMAQVDDKGIKKIKENIGKLKSEGKTIILIEHDLNNIDIADRVLYLDDGRLKTYEGELG